MRKVLHNIAFSSSFFDFVRVFSLFSLVFRASKLLGFKEFNKTVIPFALFGYETGYSQFRATRLVGPRHEIIVNYKKLNLRISDFQHFHRLAGHRLSVHILAPPEGRFTRYDFVACDKLTTGLRHDLRLSQRFKTCFKMLRHFFDVHNNRKSCRGPVVSRCRMRQRLTTGPRHDLRLLCTSKKCRSILKHVLKRCDNRKSCRRPVVSLSHATKSYRVNRPSGGASI